MDIEYLVFLVSKQRLFSASVKRLVFRNSKGAEVSLLSVSCVKLAVDPSLLGIRTQFKKGYYEFTGRANILIRG